MRRRRIFRQLLVVWGHSGWFLACPPQPCGLHHEHAACCVAAALLGAQQGAVGRAGRTPCDILCGLPKAVQGKREKALLAQTDLDIFDLCQEMLRP